jgi:hypothetical protein
MNRTDLTKKTRAAATRVLEAKGYISVVDVLLAMGRLSKENYERWRFRRCYPKLNSRTRAQRPGRGELLFPGERSGSAATMPAALTPHD